MKQLAILIFLLFLLACNSNSCIYNEQANPSWMTNFKIDHLGVFIKDSLKWYIDIDHKIPVKTYHICDTIKKDCSIISIQEEVYSDPCQAKKRFDDELKYYQFGEAKYEMKDGPHFGLLQGAHYYSIDSNVGWDTLADNVFNELKKALSLNPPDKNSTFTRYTFIKAVVQ
jgi:hypothetical protein